jgi:hypothetical protein
MSFYSITVQEAKPGSKLRRRMAIEAGNREQAISLLNEKCSQIGFAADKTTLKEISRKEYEKIINTLVGKSN